MEGIVAVTGVECSLESSLGLPLVGSTPTRSFKQLLFSHKVASGIRGSLFLEHLQ